MSKPDFGPDVQRAKRSRGDRIARLRRRLQQVPEGNPATEGLLDIIKGMLDLLEDEL